MIIFKSAILLTSSFKVNLHLVFKNILHGSTEDPDGGHQGIRESDREQGHFRDVTLHSYRMIPDSEVPAR